MATVKNWNPFGVSMNITATAGTVTRKSATQYTVKINASWTVYYSGNKTNYGMKASSGGGSVTLNPFGTKAGSGSGSFTGTYSISGNGSATKTITVTFKNYNNDNGKSATKTVSFSVTVPAWTSYKVTYKANGGTGAPDPQTKWKDQTLTLSSVKPTRSGYTFVGWNTSEYATSASYSAGGSYKSNASITLYAIWKKTITLTYDANGGSGAPSKQSATVYNTTTSYKFTLHNTKPTRTGYTFLGWSTSNTATSATYSAEGTITLSASDVLYAVWKINSYPLTVNPNGGTWRGTTAKTVINGNYNSTVTIENPTWTGHTFSGWTLSGSGTLSGTTYKFGAGSGTLTAKWDTNDYDIVFNAVTNGGTVSGVETTTKTVEYGSKIGTLPTAVKKNHTFLGWYTSPTGGTKITSDYVVTKNMTFYAHFEIDTSAYINELKEWYKGVTFVNNSDGEAKKGHAKVNVNGRWKDGLCD